MLITPDLSHIADVEADLRPPLSFAVTIPLAIDGRHYMHDGIVVYVGLSAFEGRGNLRGAASTVATVAKAVGDALSHMPATKD